MYKNLIYTSGIFLVVCAVSLVPFLRFPSLAMVPCANSGSCQTLPQLDVENGATGLFENRVVRPPLIDLAEAPHPQTILGETTVTGEKHIYVDLSTQTLKAYQGDELFMQTLVSTGKWNKTPTGEYTIWIKLRSTRMSGGSGADYYNLPNVPYVMFFYNERVSKIAGYSFHGAYWHNNFGHAMSHGCINMREVDAKRLYEWAMPVTEGSITYASATNAGTGVTIY